MVDYSHRLFIAFAAEDRYAIAEPLVYHLKNYGVNVWYDRHSLLLGDNRVRKNLDDGARLSPYACIIISKHTVASRCAMEEISIIRKRYCEHDVIVFPVLYEFSPEDIPCDLYWVKEVIYKEATRRSGTREICNHVACKISENMLMYHPVKSISDFMTLLPTYASATRAILCSYEKIDHANLNSRISLLYAVYIILTCASHFPNNTEVYFAQQVFNRLFSETQLNIAVDYREIWLLENALCILANYYLSINMESSI